ncbi:hypothetical protein LXL04_027276 [Taraxacum kok-saghyz]
MVQLSMRYVTCAEDAVIFMALAVAVDLSVEACRLFRRMNQKKQVTRIRLHGVVVTNHSPKDSPSSPKDSPTTPSPLAVAKGAGFVEYSARSLNNSIIKALTSLRSCPSQSIHYRSIRVPPMAKKYTQITAATHLTTKLTPHNYPVWRRQVEATLISLELEDFIIGSSNQPPKEVKDKDGKSISNPEYLLWYRKDQMILSALLGSCSESIQPLISSAPTARQAWERLNSSFASFSRSRIISLKSKLTKNPKGNRSITEFLQEMRSIADALALAQSPVSEEDLMVYILSQLGDDYNTIAAAIKVRENPLSYSELFDKLTDNYTSRQQGSNYRNSTPRNHNNRSHHSGSQRGGYHSQSQGPGANSHGNRNNITNEFCQYCNIPGHLTRDCRKLARFLRENNVLTDKTAEPVANVTAAAPASPSWLVDTGASHHVTSDKHTLHQVSEYGGPDEIVLGDGTGLPISNIGVYHIRSSPKLQVHVTLKHTPIGLHHNLGHPSLNVFKSIVSKLGLSSKFVSNVHCSSFSINKSHKLPFGPNSFVATAPLQLIYSDVWGLVQKSIDNYTYYVIFVDYFTKYVWLYPMTHKSDVAKLFPTFKALVEKYFQHPIVSLFSDNGGEYLGLLPFLQTHGISHYTTPPHTPEQNGIAERRHRHIVETGLSLLHHAKLLLTYWSHAFQTAVYLINRLPTTILNNKSPYECLFHQQPNYYKLKPFGCLCYPWIRPYTTSKLQPRSKPCLFLGYSSSKSAFKCYDLETKKLYHSRHVEFVPDHFPSHKLNPTDPLPTPDIFLTTKLHTTNHNDEPPVPTETSSPTTPPQILTTPLPPTTTDTPIPQADSPTIPTAVSPQPPLSPNPPSNETSPPSPHITPSPSPQPLPARRPHKPNSKYYNPIFINTATLHPIPPTIEPRTHIQALRDPNWRKAMDDEFNALLMSHPQIRIWRKHLGAGDVIQVSQHIHSIVQT